MNATITNEVKVGDIFQMSWGYDQTNVDYFQITRVTEKGVFVREINSEQVTGTEGAMCCKVRPIRDSFLQQASWCCRPNIIENRETFRRLVNGGFNFKGRYFAHKVAADSKTYCSWYA
jgi:hypothetical protein